MDPLTLAATAVVATVLTKALEKTGEKLGEKVFDKSEKFIASLKKSSPSTVVAIEKASEQPLDYGRAVLDVDAVSKKDPEVAEAVEALALAAQEDQNQKLAWMILEVLNTLKNQPPTIQNLEKLAEKIGLVVQGGNVTIQTLNVE
jgi:cell division protein FtsN